MSLVVTQRPTLTVLDLTSNWNAIRNPVVYKMQRKDFTFDQINNDGGDIQLQFTGVDVTASFIVGDVLYIKSDNDVYDVFGEITVSAFAAGDTLVTVDSPYISAAPGGFTNNDNLRPSYRVAVDVLTDALDEITDAPIIYSPNTKGALLIDISEPLKNILTPDLVIDLADGGDNIFLDTIFTDFHITYTEIWDGSAESPTDDGANVFYGVLGARQIPSPNGGNLLEYVASHKDQIIENGSFTGTLVPWTNRNPGDVNWAEVGDQAEFATGALEVTKWLRQICVLKEGVEYTLTFTRTVSAINQLNEIVRLGDGVTTTDLQNAIVTALFQVVVITFTPTQDWSFIEFKAENTDLSAHSGQIEDVSIDYALTPAKFLTRLTRPKIWRESLFLISGIWQPETADNFSFRVIYRDADGAALLTSISDVSDDPGLYIWDLIDTANIPALAVTADLMMYNNLTNTVISEILVSDIVDACQNPITLIGRNSLGGLLVWVFDGSQEVDFDYGGGIKAKRLVLFAENLTANEWDALQDFITLGDVYRENILELTSETNKTSKRIDQQLYVVDSNNNMIGVVAIPTRNKTRTRNEKHIFEIEIEYPETF